VNDQLEGVLVVGEHAVQALAIADVQLDPPELAWVALGEPLADRPRRGLGPEELRAHVVLEADDVEPLLDEVLDGLGPDQPA
jgi:hypothetical protein